MLDGRMIHGWYAKGRLFDIKLWLVEMVICSFCLFQFFKQFVVCNHSIRI